MGDQRLYLAGYRVAERFIIGGRALSVSACNCRILHQVFWWQLDNSDTNCVFWRGFYSPDCYYLVRFDQTQI